MKIIITNIFSLINLKINWYINLLILRRKKNEKVAY